MTTAALNNRASTLPVNARRNAVPKGEVETAPGSQGDQVQLSAQAANEQEPTLREALGEFAKGLPNLMLRHTVGALCLPFGVALGALYSGTLVGPLITAASTPSREPSIEDAYFQTQFPMAQQVLMGSADAAASGASAMGVFCKEMAAPLTMGYDAYQIGCNLLR
jgi:hypothetical protein